MSLTDLDPRWLSAGSGRHGMGISFLCPVHLNHRLAVMFANPIDGGEIATGHRYHWQRQGETFETLTLGPSVDASGVMYGYNEIKTPCWHGFIKEGQIA